MESFPPTPVSLRAARAEIVAVVGAPAKEAGSPGRENSGIRFSRRGPDLSCRWFFHLTRLLSKYRVLLLHFSCAIGWKTRYSSFRTFRVGAGRGFGHCFAGGPRSLNFYKASRRSAGRCRFFGYCKGRLCRFSFPGSPWRRHVSRGCLVSGSPFSTSRTS